MAGLFRSPLDPHPEEIEDPPSLNVAKLGPFLAGRILSVRNLTLGSRLMIPYRVLVISHTYAAPVNRLKFEIMARNPRFEFVLVTPRRWRNYVTRAENPAGGGRGNYHTCFVDPWFGRHPVLYLIPGLRRIIGQFRPQLIYCEQEPLCLVSLQAALASSPTPILYFTWENIDRKDFRYRLFSGVRSLCLKKSIFMAAGSKEAAAVIRKHGYRKPIYITPILGVSEDLFFPRKGPLCKAKAEKDSGWAI